MTVILFLLLNIIFMAMNWGSFWTIINFSNYFHFSEKITLFHYTKRIWFILQYFLVFINYKVLISTYIDIFTFFHKYYSCLIDLLSKFSDQIKKRMKYFYLLINDLGYSQKMKEIIFHRESLNKKTFTIPILNCLIMIFLIFKILQGFFKIFQYLLQQIINKLTQGRKFLRKVNRNFYEKYLNIYLKVVKFRYLGVISNCHVFDACFNLNKK